MAYLADTTYSYIQTVDNNITTILAAAKGLLCVPYLLSKFKATSLMLGLAEAAVAIALSALQTVAMIVEGVVQQITGEITALMRYFLSLLDDLTKSLTMVRTYILSLFMRAKGLVDYLLDMQNCQLAGANIFSCIVKYAENTINRKIVQTYQNDMSGVVNQISNNIAATGGVIQHNINREIYMAGQFQAQLAI